MIAQPQLIQQALVPKDIIFTPDWVALDMVKFFKPIGRVLEPCIGDNAIYKYLPGADWCEINKGRDFFAWNHKVDWIIGNPPYNAKRFNDWLNHSYDIAENIVYLFPLYYIHRSASKFKIVQERGNLVHGRYYGTGTELGFPMGNPIFGMYLKRGYHGDTSWSKYEGEKP